MLAGAGLALNTGPAVTLAMAAIPPTRTGLASGVVNLARLLGITVGVAVLGSAMTVVGGATGVRAALLAGAACQLVGAVLALRLTRRIRAPAEPGTRTAGRSRVMREAQELASASEVDIAAVAALLADPARCKVLLALDDGRALPARCAGRGSRDQPRHRQQSSGQTAPMPGFSRCARRAATAITDWPDLRSARSSSSSAGWRRPGRSPRCGRARAPRGCARPEPVMTTSPAGLGVQLMGSLLDRGVLTGGDGWFHPGGTDRLSSPGHDDALSAHRWRRRPAPSDGNRIAQRPKATGALLQWTGPSSVTTSPAGWAGRCSISSWRRGGCAAPAPPRPHRDRFRPRRLGDRFGIDWTG